MCGRYTVRYSAREIGKSFGVEIADGLFSPRYNIAPTQAVLTVRDELDGPAAAMVRWGLIPSWAKDAAIGSRMINARGETVASKPAFRSAFKRRRCLIAADGFYEWAKAGKAKQPWFFQLPDSEPFGFAGLWESWTSPDGDTIETATIITTEANDTLAPVHDRMPVILSPEDHAWWLDPDSQGGEPLKRMLRPYDGAMEAWPVSSRVNSPRNDGADLITPIPL